MDSKTLNVVANSACSLIILHLIYILLLIIFFVKTETNLLESVFSIIIFDLYIPVTFAIVY